MADETVEIDVNVNGVDEAAGKFTRLQTQIRETRIALQQAQEAGDTVQFNKLKKDLDDLEDKLEVTQLKSKQFDDALAGLPGPAGKAGQAIKGLDGVFKLIAANPIVATIAGLSALFLALRESLSRTEEGTKALSRISEGFERVLNGIFAIIEPLALAFADFVGDLLENQKAMKFLGTTVGIVGGTFSALFSILKTLGNFVVNNFTNAFRSLTGVLSGVGQVLEGVFTFNYSKIKAGVAQVSDTVVTGFNDLVDNVKETGKGLYTAVTDDFMAGFDAAEASFEEGTKRLTKKEREEKKKRDEQAKKDAEEAAKKRAEALKEADRVITEAELSLLDERQRKLKERENKFIEDKKKLIAAGITDFTTLETAYREDIADINKEFDEKDKKDRETKLKEEFEAEKLALDLKKSQGLLSEEEYQKALYDLKKKYATDATALTQAEIENNNALKEQEKQRIDDEIKNREQQAEGLKADYEFRKSIGAATYADQLNYYDQVRALERQNLVAKKAEASEIEAFDKETAAGRIEIERSVAAAKLGVISGALGQIADAVGRNTVAGKALAVAQATVDTYVGANKALATYPPPFGAIAAGTVILAGLLNVKKILSTKVPSPPGSNLGGGAAGGGSAPSAPPVPAFANPTLGAPQIGATAAQTGTLAGIVAGSINRNNSQAQPIRAYVIGNEVSTQQQLDRRIRTAARLGG